MARLRGLDIFALQVLVSIDSKLNKVTYRESLSGASWHPWNLV